MVRILLPFLIFLFPFSNISAQFQSVRKLNTLKSNATSPVIKKSKTGIIFLTWIDDNINPDGDIYFTSSFDDGTSFSAPKVIVGNSNINSKYKRAANIAVDDQD